MSKVLNEEVINKRIVNFCLEDNSIITKTVDNIENGLQVMKLLLKDNIAIKHYIINDEICFNLPLDISEDDIVNIVEHDNKEEVNIVIIILDIKTKSLRTYPIYNAIPETKIQSILDGTLNFYHEELGEENIMGVYLNYYGKTLINNYDSRLIDYNVTLSTQSIVTIFAIPRRIS
eukprot:TRINITY_DN15249_c0_g1_i1.p1 TRINITY_DN15249_c0_g1~~TRINITY_DN15249_c0_g1_i1.p1  ORF type:complete len:175 (+),score=24.41 TRINITY_DN15249_c0_g1_i1:143-667(+)